MMKEKIILILICLLALFLRVYKLNDIPTGLHGDEASIGYNAYSLLTTLHDQNGNFLPLAIDQFGDYRPAGYHYIDIPFVAVLGLNEIAVRLPSAIFGTITVLIFYLLSLELFKNRKLALLASFLLAITPWHINISRATSEGVIAAFFIISGIYFFLKIFTLEKQNKFIFLSFASFFISFLFYHSARFFVPAIIIFLISLAFFRLKPERKTLIKLIIAFFLLIFSLFLLLKISHGANRPADISIFNIPGGDKLVYQQIGEDGQQNPLITRFFHNKLFFYSRLFFESYSQHLSFDFLFVNNGLPIRYRVPWTGNLYLFYAPFLFMGISFLFFKSVKEKQWLFSLPLIWILLGAIPGGLTFEDVPNIQRSSLMIYPLIIITAYGFYEFMNLFSKHRIKRIILTISFVFLTYNYLYFYHNYFYHIKIHEPWHRSAAEKELIYQVSLLEQKYNKIVMTTDKNNNFIFYLFYNKFSPALFQKMGSPKEKDGLVFQKIIYTGNPCPLQGNPQNDLLEDENVIYVNRDNCLLPKNAIVLNTLRTPDGIPTFKIVKLLPLTEKSNQSQKP